MPVRRLECAMGGCRRRPAAAAPAPDAGAVDGDTGPEAPAGADGVPPRWPSPPRARLRSGTVAGRLAAEGIHVAEEELHVAEEELHVAEEGEAGMGLRSPKAMPPTLAAWPLGISGISGRRTCSTNRL